MIFTRHISIARSLRITVMAGALLSLLVACASSPTPPVPTTRQTLLQPVDYIKKTSPFGPRAGRYHEGIDFAADRGTRVRAAADGRVTFSGWQSGYGRIIILAHGPGFSTRYAHLSENRVTVGTAVKRGQVIGLVGASGNATGPHLHFEVRLQGQAVDPAPYLDQKKRPDTPAVEEGPVKGRPAVQIETGS